MRLKRGISFKVLKGHFRPTEILSLSACSLMILWGPLYYWVLGFDGAGRIPRLLLICAFLLSFSSIKKTSFKKPLLLYLLLGVYMFLNGLVKGGQNFYPQDGVYRLLVDSMTGPFMLLILVNLFRKHFDKTLLAFIVVLYVYLVLFVAFAGFEEKGDYIRLNGEVNANEAALHIAICFMLILLLFSRKGIKLQLTILLSVLPIWAILKTGSRMAFIMCVIAVVGTVLVNYYRRNKLKTGLLLLVFVVVGGLLLNYTMIGERLSSTTTQVEGSSWATGTAWDLLGDRGIAFYNSWPYFLAQPITGIGFRKWGILNPIGFVAHSEYLVLYLENGVLGFALYFFIIAQLYKRLVHCGKLKNTSLSVTNTAKCLQLCLCVILVANSMLWTFNEYGVFVIYAMCFVFPSIYHSATPRSH